MQKTPFLIGWFTKPHYFSRDLLLMAQILHHLGCIKPGKYWDFNYQPQLVNAGFQPSTVSFSKSNHHFQNGGNDLQGLTSPFQYVLPLGARGSSHQGRHGWSKGVGCGKKRPFENGASDILHMLLMENSSDMVHTEDHPVKFNKLIPQIAIFEARYIFQTIIFTVYINYTPEV